MRFSLLFKIAEMLEHLKEHFLRALRGDGLDVVLGTLVLENLGENILDLDDLAVSLALHLLDVVELIAKVDASAAGSPIRRKAESVGDSKMNRESERERNEISVE